MAKKFWEREDFDIALFASVFNSVYALFYECVNESDSKVFDAHRQDGDAMLYDDDIKPLVKAFNTYRDDQLTSDREMATFAVVYNMFWDWAKCKEG